MAERQGFEPWIPCGIHAFQACAFSHSAISPLRFRAFLNLPQLLRCRESARPGDMCDSNVLITGDFAQDKDKSDESLDGPAAVYS
jgi:hypothetical protein